MAGRNAIVISVLANTKGLKKGLGETEGFLGKLGKGAGFAAKTVAGIGAAVAGLAIAGGISRALKLDEANTKFKALGYNGEQVSSIMDSALASVRGTSYGLGEAATVAANALAAGVKPGQDLTAALTTVTNTAALAGVGMDEMGAIFSKVWANGKVTTAEMNQLADRGVPVWQYLSEAFGVSNEELRKMISNGQVTAEMFEGALRPNVEGIAGVMGGTFLGSIANANAALGRLGEMFVGPLITAATPWIGVMTEGIDTVAGKLKPLAEAWNEWLEGLSPDNIGDAFSNLSFDGIMEAITAAVSNAVEWFTNGGVQALFIAISNARVSILNAALEAFPGILEALVQIIPDLVRGTAEMIRMMVLAITQAAPEILSAGIEMLLGLVDAAIQIVPELIATVIALVPELASSLVRMIPKLIEGAVQLFTGLVEAIPVILPMLIRSLADLAPVLITTLISLIPVLIQGAVQLFLGIVQAVPKILPDLILAIIEIIPILIENLLTQIPLFIQLGVELIGGLISGIWEAAQGLFAAHEEIFGIVLGVIQHFGGLIGDWIGEKWGEICAYFDGVLADIGGFFETTWNNIVTGVTTWLEDILTKVTQWGTDTWNAISTKWEEIMTFFGSIPGRILGFFSAAGSWLIDSGNKIITGLRQGFIDKWNDVRTWFTTRKTAILGFLSGIGSWLKSTGSDLIRGLIDGVKDMAQSVLNAVGDVINGAIGWAKDLLGIASPSKVFAKMGKQVDEGLAKGLKGSTHLVKNAMKDVNSAVVDNFNASLSGQEVMSSIEYGYSGRNSRFGDVYQIELKTLNADAETGRAVAQALQKYKGQGGRVEVSYA